MDSMSKAERDALIHDVCTSVDQVPVLFQEKLLVRTVRDNALLSMEDVEAWVELVSPFPLSPGLQNVAGMSIEHVMVAPRWVLVSLVSV